MTNDTPEPAQTTQFVSDDELYRHTSQYRLWSMTKEALETRRRETHRLGAEKTRQAIHSKAQELGVTVTTEQIEGTILSYEEEQMLVLAYAAKVENIAQLFNMPSQVKATAVSYVKKFYLVHSVMDYHPKNILYTCVFLAAKAENFFVPVAKFCSHLPKSEPSHILDLEFLVLESLSFTLMVQNGIRLLHGFFLDLQAVVPTTSKEALGDVLNNARSILLKGLLSDALFHFTPPQIALAGLSLANEELINQYLETKFSFPGTSKISVHDDGPGIHDLTVLLSVISDCKATLQNVTIPDSVTYKEIDRKLHISLHPQKLLNPAKRKLSSVGGRPPQSPVPGSADLGAAATPTDSPSESGSDAKRIKLDKEEEVKET